MKVAEIMTPDPITVGTDTALEDAMALMEVQDVRHLPVLEGEWLAGIISDRDLMAATGWPPARPLDVTGKDPRTPRTVRDVMQHPVSTVSPQDGLLTVSTALILRKIGCLPVVDDGRLVGIVTERDVLKLYGPSWKDSLLSGDVDPFVEKHMTADPVTVDASTPLGEAVSKCRQAAIRHLPVLDGKRLVGMVSDRDLRQAAGSGRPDHTPIRKIMTPYSVRIGRRDGLSKAAKIMLESRVSALPVMDGETLIGILTSTDVLHHCVDCLKPRAQSQAARRSMGT